MRKTNSVKQRTRKADRPPPEFKQKLSYWQTLGQFISMFSGVEEAIQRLLWAHANVQEPISQAVFSGVRVDNGSGLIRRVIEAKGEKISPALAAAFTQLSLINSLRNQIVHYGATQANEDEWHVSNALIAHNEAKLTKHIISPNVILHMTRDLVKIRVHLLLEKIRIIGKTPLSDDDVVEMEGMIALPWHYKPHLQAKTRHKTPLTRVKQQRQRKASLV